MRKKKLKKLKPEVRTKALIKIFEETLLEIKYLQNITSFTYRLNSTNNTVEIYVDYQYKQDRDGALIKAHINNIVELK